MPSVEIHELVVQLDAEGPDSGMTPAMFARFMQVWQAQHERNERAEQARRSEHDLRPIVEQQRDAGRWGGGGR